jgi:hypothetical protein
MAFILDITTARVKKYLDMSGSEVRGQSSNNCGQQVAAVSSTVTPILRVGLLLEKEDSQKTAPLSAHRRHV